jgi:hypothetical protein
MALAKFGSFSGLRATTSSSSDLDPSTPTFSFYGSIFSSKYIGFTPVELYTNQVDKATGSWQVLQQPTPQQVSLLEKWDRSPYTSEAGSIPFVYFAGRYVLAGAQYDAGHISGWSIARAAAYVTSGKSSTSRNAEAAAGYLVGAFCALTRDMPARVCSVVPDRLKR